MRTKKRLLSTLIGIATLSIMCIVGVQPVKAEMNNVTGTPQNGPAYKQTIIGSNIAIGSISLQDSTDFGKDSDVIFNGENKAQVAKKDYGENGTIQYTLANNTLTLTNFNLPDYNMYIGCMGDDFKIVIEGDCHIRQIISNAEGYGGSITLDGSGTLYVNEKYKSPGGIFMQGFCTAFKDDGIYASVPIFFEVKGNAVLCSHRGGYYPFTIYEMTQESDFTLKGYSNQTIGIGNSSAPGNNQNMMEIMGMPLYHGYYDCGIFIVASTQDRLDKAVEKLTNPNSSFQEFSVVKLPKTDYTYTGSAIKPTPEVRDDSNNLLTEGTHYTLVYGAESSEGSLSKCIEPGTYYVQAIGKGPFEGYIGSTTYRIVKGDGNTGGGSSTGNPSTDKDSKTPVDSNKTVATSDGGKATTTADGNATLNQVAKTTKKTIKVPEKLTVGNVDYTVTTIGTKAFANAPKATTVTLPKTVTKISANAFAKSKITTVKITVQKGAKLTVDKKAFKKSKVKKIQITMKGATKKQKNAMKNKLTKICGGKITVKVK